MSDGAQIAMLPDGRRLHMQYGPIDLIVEADGESGEVALAYRQAAERFPRILPELVEELPRLRQTADSAGGSDCFRGNTARRMAEAAMMHRGVFVTPMAGVAGAVADEMLAALTAGRRVQRAYVNNGGDIAIFLDKGAEFAVGLVARLDKPEPAGSCSISAEMPVRGVATSGWRGRSFSLGVADAVTVLARNAATADVAATLIANRVNVNHPAIERRPARELDPDSDLGLMAVTVGVGPLDDDTRNAALDAGQAAAERMCESKLIYSAAILLEGEVRVAGPGLARSLPAGR